MQKIALNLKKNYLDYTVQWLEDIDTIPHSKWNEKWQIVNIPREDNGAAETLAKEGVLWENAKA